MLQKILHTLEAMFAFLGTTSIISILLYVKLAKGLLKFVFKVAIVLTVLAALAVAILYFVGGGKF